VDLWKESGDMYIYTELCRLLQTGERSDNTRFLLQQPIRRVLGTTKKWTNFTSIKIMLLKPCEVGKLHVYDSYYEVPRSWQSFAISKIEEIPSNCQCTHAVMYRCISAYTYALVWPELSRPLVDMTNGQRR
jgi:hypothetical protein